MSGFIGQRFDDAAALPGAYVRVPAAASAPIRDDRPIGANVAAVLHNNASHLAFENLRPLAWWQSNAALSQTDPWAVGLRDVVRPDAAEDQPEVWETSWAPGYAFHVGPIAAVQDREGDAGEALLRRIVLDVEIGNVPEALYIAITPGFHPLPPYLGYVAFSKEASLSTGANTFVLDAEVPITRGERVPCRPVSSGIATVSSAVWFHVWFSWISTDGADRIEAVSVYEQRP